MVKTNCHQCFQNYSRPIRSYMGTKVLFCSRIKLFYYNWSNLTGGKRQKLKKKKAWQKIRINERLKKSPEIFRALEVASGFEPL